MDRKIKKKRRTPKQIAILSLGRISICIALREDNDV